jgi:hypothetical protein
LPSAGGHLHTYERMIHGRGRETVKAVFGGDFIAWGREVRACRRIDDWMSGAP